MAGEDLCVWSNVNEPVVNLAPGVNVFLNPRLTVSLPGPEPVRINQISRSPETNFPLDHCDPAMGRFQW
jgi:hypothetical protein